MKAPHYLSILVGLSLSVHGQSADSLTAQPEVKAPDTPTATTENSPATVIPEQPRTQADPELINVPSRYAGIDLEAYIHTVSSTFSMRKRERDSFGRHQDPNFKPPIQAPTRREIPKYKPAPVTPFSDIVAAIRINTIIPAQQKFLIKGRSFRTGDKIELSTGNGKIIPVYVVSVNPDRVTFRHGVTNETADQSLLQFLPEGFTPGGGSSIRPAGITSPDDQAPIDISGSGAGNSLSSSR